MRPKRTGLTRLWRYTEGRRRRLTVVLSLAAVSAAAPVAMWHIVGDAIDNGIVAGDTGRLTEDVVAYLAIGGCAVVGTVLSVGTLLAGIERVGASTASVLSTVEPAVTVLLAVLFLEESASAVQLLGGALLLVAIVLFSVINFHTMWLNLVVRIALMPLVAGLSYEVIRYAAKKESGAIFKFMTMPGLWLQNITTQEPDGEQLEVAIRALDESLKLEPQSA